MADNTTLNTGSGGDVISTDDIGGGVKVQRVKLQFGADGSAADVTPTNGLPCLAGNLAQSTAAWTSATANNTALTITCTGYGVVTLTLRSGSTMSAGQLTFEMSDDNTNWYPVFGFREGSTHVREQIYALTASDTQTWTFPVGSATNFRVRLNPQITGSGTLNLGLTAAANVDPTMAVAAPYSATATLSNVGSSASNVTILSANPKRTKVILVNDSTQTLLIKYGATASATSYTYSIPQGDTWEMPTDGSSLYKGQIDGIWASANGNARVTEMST